MSDEISNGLPIDTPEQRVAALGAPGVLATSLRDHLGDPEVVNGLVATFGEFVSAVRAGYNAGDIDAARAPEIIRAEAEKMQRIFYGEAEGYTPQPWNSPEQLGERVAKRMNYNDGTANAVTGLFVSLANDLLRIMVKAEDGEIAEQDWQWQVSAALETVAGLLLGYPDSMIDGR